jgi:hypothetical protein
VAGSDVTGPAVGALGDRPHHERRLVADDSGCSAPERLAANADLGVGLGLRVLAAVDAEASADDDDLEGLFVEAVERLRAAVETGLEGLLITDLDPAAGRDAVGVLVDLLLLADAMDVVDPATTVDLLAEAGALLLELATLVDPGDRRDVLVRSARSTRRRIVRASEAGDADAVLVALDDQAYAWEQVFAETGPADAERDIVLSELTRALAERALSPARRPGD